MKDEFAKLSKDTLEFGEIINEGTYGVVYKGFYKTEESKKIVAIKKLKKIYPEEIIIPTTSREINNLKNLSHPNIVKLIDIIIEKSDIFLVFEYIETDLNKFLYKFKNNLTKELIKNIFYQILKGLEYLHSKCIIHRDLKPKNILISKKGDIVKITDLGLSRKLNIVSPIYSKRVGSLNYMAPEILLNFNDYSYGVDIWSAACILYELIFKKILFDGKDYEDQLHSIEKLIGTPTNQNWPNIEKNDNYKNIYQSIQKGIFDNKTKYLSKNEKDILKRMLLYDPNKRISIKAALSHVSIYFIL